MRVAQALWVCMLGSAVALPAAAADGRIQFTGRIVVPADCRANVDLRHGEPLAAAACPARASASDARLREAPLVDVAIEPLPAAGVGARAYVVELTYH